LIQSKTSQQKDEFGTNPKDRVSKFKELSTKAKDQQLDPEKPLENQDIKNSFNKYFRYSESLGTSV
jgi:hypothetical protein